MQKERQSNFELLRILCMWGVLTNHVIQNLYDVHTSNFSLANETRVLLMNMSIVAVNGFIFISGYFKINPSWKGIVRLYAQIAFYVALFTAVGMVWGGVDLKISLLHMLFPLSHSGMWFMTAYFALFLLAPILNAAFEKANRIEQRLWMLALILVDVYIGYMHQAPEITQNGYHIVHFITLYFIGRYISSVKLINAKWGGVFLLIALLMTGLHAVKMLFPPIAIIYSMRYNSPAVMIASVVFFLWVCTWKIQSKIINWISGSVLSVYIIHSQPVVSEFFFGGLKQISQSLPSLLAGLAIVGSMFCLYICCILLDRVRITLINPQADKVSALIKNKCDVLCAKFLS